MTLPAQFTGAWRRRSISLAGREPIEPSHVIWVQAGTD